MSARRTVVTVALSLLLILMQSGALLHALAHDGERLNRADAAALATLPSADPCNVCTWFAGGAHASPAAEPRAIVGAAARPCIGTDAPTIVARAPVHYRSRAPPVLS